jgi:hypothetical protein
VTCTVAEFIMNLPIQYTERGKGEGREGEGRERGVESVEGHAPRMMRGMHQE